MGIDWLQNKNFFTKFASASSSVTKVGVRASLYIKIRQLGRVPSG